MRLVTLILWNLIISVTSSLSIGFYPTILRRNNILSNCNFKMALFLGDPIYIYIIYIYLTIYVYILAAPVHCMCIY